MLRSIMLAALPLVACAAPTETDFMSLLSRRAEGASSPMSTCNVGAITMNAAGLPSPTPGLLLDHIAIGRGTQNYTCDNSTEQAIPKAAGAVATLFNVTCLAGPYPPLLDTMTGIALKFPPPVADSGVNPANLFLLGHHYFTDTTTPVFNLNTAVHNWGVMACSKLNSTTAKTNPETNVPNLLLATKSREGCTISEVYRLNTVGGQPPKTCKGKEPTFQVQYAVEYWFWASPDLSSYT